jgi:predicted ATPase
MLRDSRLVTLTGAGGVGKTRTAFAVGQAIPESMASETLLVEFASLATGSLVGNALAQVLGVRDSPRRPMLEDVLTRLRQKSIVLIFDNCEHVRVEVATLARKVLAACPDVRIIATSREPLGIAAEEPYRVPSLRVPNGYDAPVSRAAAAGYSAVRLFVERAQAADGGFALTDRNAAIVAELCRRLDGIPLAIELAAARTKTFPPQVLLAQLDTRFQKLRNANRKALRRQQTMTALIDWSFDLLTPPEQRSRGSEGRLYEQWAQ